jgi:hypothetical protein
MAILELYDKSSSLKTILKKRVCIPKKSSSILALGIALAIAVCVAVGVEVGVTAFRKKIPNE